MKKISFLLCFYLWGCTLQPAANHSAQTSLQAANTNQSNYVNATVRMQINAQGHVEDAYIWKSSGIKSIDDKLLTAVRTRTAQLKFKVIKSLSYPIFVDQPFIIDLNSTEGIKFPQMETQP
jgi:TonB family protein